MKEIIISPEKIGNISFLRISGDGPAPGPLVFFVHGVGSDKRQGIRLGCDLARLGFTYVSMDTVMRGDRADEEFDPQIGEKVKDLYPPATGIDDGLNMFMMIRQTINDLKDLISHFKMDSRIDPERIGLVGYSMGGMIAYCGAGFIPELKAVCSIASFPGIEDLWNDIVLECSNNTEWKDAMELLKDESQKWAMYLRDMDPSDNLKSYPEKPLLIIGGGDDTIAPRHHSLDLYRSLLPLYKNNPDNLRLSIYDGIDHQFTPLMMEEITDWFESLWI